jgi:formylglycine-generating enzyme required for sulfatase activity
MVQDGVSTDRGPGPPGVRFSGVTLRAAEDEDALDVTFDLRWTGSWGPGQRGPGFSDRNWDAVWVFFKYRFSGQREIPFDGLDEAGLTRDLDAGYSDETLARSLGFWPVAHPWLCLSIQPEVVGSRWIVEVRRQVGDPSYPVLVERDEARRCFRLSARRRFRHAQITRVLGHPGEALVELVPNETGAFLRRAPGAPPLRDGVADYRGVTLRCRLRELFPVVEVKDTLDVWPFGLEMVYVPEEPFWLGDPRPPRPGGHPRNCFHDALAPETSPNRAYRVDSEEAIQVGPRETKAPPGVTRLLWYNNDDDARRAGDHARIHAPDYKTVTEKLDEARIPAGYPKGFAAFYVMKRQVSQSEYAAFINALDGGDSQENESYGQLVRFAWDGGGTTRGTIEMPYPGSNARVASRPLRANNHMCWADAIAFAAWAGLRPLSELEYEKACRGPKEPVHREFAWGEGESPPPGLGNRSRQIFGEEDGTEVVVGACNINNREAPFVGGDGGCGPVRDDAFQRRGHGKPPALSTRAIRMGAADAAAAPAAPEQERGDRGLSYYGVAALTGNLWELCVTVGTAEGRRYAGTHGLGELTEYGEAPFEELGWPDQTARSVSWRGGSWYTDYKRGFVAARPYGNGAPGFFLRTHDAGFRGARTASAARSLQFLGTTLRVDPARLLSWLSPAAASARLRADPALAGALHEPQLSARDYQVAYGKARIDAYQDALAVARDPALLARVAALPLPPGVRLLGLGDGLHRSVDVRSGQLWSCNSSLDVLRHVLRKHHPDDTLQVETLGVPGETTTALLDRLVLFVEGLTAEQRATPAVVLCCAGLGDARRIVALDRPRVGLEETRANLEAVRAYVEKTLSCEGVAPRWVWLARARDEGLGPVASDEPAPSTRLQPADAERVAAVVRALAAAHGDVFAELGAYDRGNVSVLVDAITAAVGGRVG